MLQRIQAKDFKAVPYLEGSQLMSNHPEGVRLCADKPNVIVGPNGAGKSALLQALALKTLAYFVGSSCLDEHFINGRDADSFWGERGYSWWREQEYLPGLACEGDLGPTLYYRPGHIPGNERCITTAMMCGYFEEARAYGRLIDDKSSGQQSQAVQEKLMKALAGDGSEMTLSCLNWRYGTKPQDPDGMSRHAGQMDYRAEELKRRYEQMPGRPLILMDEPEQSLDARAELHLWKQVERADPRGLQMVIATHSLYPLLHPQRFNIIEATPGYAAEVISLMD
ncbi:vitamin B12-transporter ATPase [compost metagenome]